MRTPSPWVRFFYCYNANMLTYALLCAVFSVLFWCLILRTLALIGAAVYVWSLGSDIKTSAFALVPLKK